MSFPMWAQAGFWGWVSGLALLLGAAVGYLARVPQRLIAGYSLFSGFSNSVVAAVTAVAAGAILTMIADTMIPEAFEGTHSLAGLVTVLGFLLAFWISKSSSG